MTPRETFEFINAYFEQVGPVIRRNCGFIGKYTGDGVMALFPRRADDAVRAAVEIRQRLFKYNEQQTVQGRSPIDVGIGVHKGTAMLGIVGEAERLQGDLIADAANVASRLEGLCRSYCAGILLSDRTFHELQEGNQFRSRSLGTIRVKGREREVGLIEICNGDPEEVAASKWATRHEFAEALALYTGGDVGLARGRFAGLLDRNSGDGAARFYLDRIDGLTHPPSGFGPPPRTRRPASRRHSDADNLTVSSSVGCIRALVQFACAIPVCTEKLNPTIMKSAKDGP